MSPKTCYVFASYRRINLHFFGTSNHDARINLSYYESSKPSPTPRYQASRLMKHCITKNKIVRQTAPGWLKELRPSYWVRLPSGIILGLRWWNGWQNGEMPNPTSRHSLLDATLYGLELVCIYCTVERNESSSFFLARAVYEEAMCHLR